MAAFFIVDYTIHFDDTMAYGGHHFLTAFKLQCASREAYLFGEHIFDQLGVKAALEEIHLLTSDAYARNLQSMQLGDRVAILLTLEQWGRASARFCYRVLNQRGERVCAGFQTLICADAKSGEPRTLPTALSDAMNNLRDIEEVRPHQSFRDIVLAGGQGLDELFGEAERAIAVEYLADRYPRPAIVPIQPIQETIVIPSAVIHNSPSVAKNGQAPAVTNERQLTARTTETKPLTEAWLFAGQGAFDGQLFCRRLQQYGSMDTSHKKELEECEQVAQEFYGEHAAALFSTDIDQCQAAIAVKPGLSQVAILLQNILGARAWRSQGHRPEFLMGHSFGEIAAFHEAGCFDLATAVRIVCLRHQAIERYAPEQSGLLAVFAERHRLIAELSTPSFSKVCIAGRNHDLQTVASGPLHQLELLGFHLRKQGIQTASISSSTSFHHPDLAIAAEQWYQSMRSCTMQPPTTKIYSPIGRRLIAQNEDLAGTLASQLLRPFDLQGALHDLAASGIAQVVDCGSTGSLAKLVTKASHGVVEVCCVAALEREGDLFCKKNSEFVSPAMINDVGNGAGTHHPQPPRNDVAIEASQTQPARPSGVSKQLPVTVIVGRGCILPAGATSPEQLFNSVMQNRVGLIDQRTFDPHWTEDFYSEVLVPDRSTSHLSGRVNDADILCPRNVDPEFFHSLTRTQKLLCIALSPCLPGLRDARRIVCLMGATADGFEDQDEASSLVFAGIDPLACDVDQLMNSGRSGFRTPHQAIQFVLDHMLGRGVQLMLIDAACASSLYTTALGMRLLETDRADAVIAGGVFCPGPGNSCLFSQFRGTTSTGCRPFDAGADGVVFSEGAAILTLRRSADAFRLGLKVDAVIRGAGLSSDGKSSSANVPQSHGQILSLQRCYQRYNIDPATITGIEGHGTSTPVGDSTEVETLRQFFGQHVTSPIPLHSLKGSIGHAGWAAGTASVIAASEYMQRKVFPAQGFFQKPSAALENAKSTLAVRTAATALPIGSQRIAVDGFGFGGANAHLVIENVGESGSDFWTPSEVIADSNGSPVVSPAAEEMVLVAFDKITPTSMSPAGARFDRSAIKLPRDFIVLPELADDMDISQTLTVILAHQIIGQLPGFDASLRNETCVVLALNGKTERGVEATTRVLSERLKRKFSANKHYCDLIEQAFNGSRPSKAYTLQCMMPNVASGRAALLHNLRGANLVVDAGVDSLDAALLTASLLLEDSGVSAKVAIVASVSAGSGSDPFHLGPTESDEHAVAFAFTTRAIADRLGWRPLLELSKFRQHLQTLMSDDGDHATGSSSMVSLIEQIIHDQSSTNATSSPAPTKVELTEDSSLISCPIHQPLWVERPLPDHISVASVANGQSSESLPAALFVVAADADLATELLPSASERFSRSRIIMIGGDGFQRLTQHDGEDLHWFESVEDSAFVELIGNFSPDLIVAIQRPRESDFLTKLKNLADDNTPCEALFLAAKHELARLDAGAVELWSLIIDGWSGEVHPGSGATAGLLKSIHREIPKARMATICTRGLSTAQSLDGLLAERTQSESETESETEIVLDHHRRLVRRLIPVVYNESSQPPVALDANSVVIASGGARGVTAVMLEAIVRDYGCTVITLGRSELEMGPQNADDPNVEKEFYQQFMADHPLASPVEMRRQFESARARWEAASNIEFLRSLGSNIEYHMVDVTDAKKVSLLIADIAERYGRVDLLVHGAGVQYSKKLQHRSLVEFRNTYQVKVHGLHRLVDACFEQFGKIAPVHVLTSAYSIFGNDGQHDYGAANETLDRLCAVRDQTTAKDWTSLAWLAWDGIGMTRGSEYQALAKQRSLSGVDKATGQSLFRAVISGRSGAAINVPLSPAEHTQYRVSTIPSGTDGLLGHWIEIPIDLNQIDCLTEHKVRDVPTLPGAWILHHFVDAAMKLDSGSNHWQEACLQQIEFQRFTRLQNGRSPNLRVVARKTDEGIHVWMIADLFHSSGQLLAKDIHCASAKITLRTSSNLNRTIADPGFNHGAMFLDDPYCRENATVSLSGPFCSLHEIAIEKDLRRAVFNDAVNGNWDMSTPALTLDAAWRVGAMYAEQGNPAMFVPVSIEEVILPIEPPGIAFHPKRWSIVSTGPIVEQDGARWSRTEVCDRNDRIKILVRNAYAKPIN